MGILGKIFTWWDGATIGTSLNSGMTGAPQISNNWGDLVTMLDACLVNGFALKAIDTLTFADGIATATISSGHAYRPFQVVEIAGAEQSGDDLVDGILGVIEDCIFLCFYQTVPFFGLEG